MTTNDYNQEEYIREEEDQSQLPDVSVGDDDARLINKLTGSSPVDTGDVQLEPQSFEVSKGDMEKLGTKNIGPFPSGEEYSAALRRPVEEAASSDLTWKDYALVGAESTFPFTNELVAKAAQYAVNHPRLSEDQWYNVLKRREERVRQESPIIGMGSAIGAPIAAGIATTVAAQRMGVPPPAAAAIGFGYAGASALGVSGKRMGEPGYTKEATADVAMSTLGPIGARTTIKYGGRILGKFMKSISKDNEARASWDMILDDPSVFNGITDVQKARDDIINEMNDVVDSITTQARNNKIDKKAAGEAFRTARISYQNAIESLARRAREIGEPTEGTAKMVEDFVASLSKKTAQMYDEAFDLAPSTEKWADAPEVFGLKYSDFISSMQEALDRRLKRGTAAIPLKGPEAAKLKQEAAQLASYHTSEMIDDLGITGGPAQILKEHNELIMNPSMLDEIMTQPMSDRMRSFGRGAFRRQPNNVNEIFVKLTKYGTTVEEVKQAANLVANLDPQIVRSYISSMHKRGSGFKDLVDMARPDSRLMSGEIERQVVKDWRDTWLRKISNQETMADFKQKYEEASNFNRTFAIPIEDRLRVRKVAQNSTARQAMALAEDIEPQIENGIRAATRYGVEESQNMIDLVKRIRTSLNASRDISKLNFSRAIEILAERKSLAEEAIDNLNMMDDVSRAQFGEVERIAREALEQKDIMMSLTKEAEDFAKQYPQLKNVTKDRIKTWMSQISTGRKSMSDLNDVKTTAADSIEAMTRYMSNGDPAAANKTMDQIRKLRAIEILNRRQVNGSRQAVQAAAGGAAAGMLFGLPSGITAVAGVIGNTVADKFTAGKWSNLSTWMIEKMLQTEVANSQKLGSKLLVEGALLREAGAHNWLYNVILPGSPESYDAIRAVMSSPQLTAVEKAKAIKKITTEGIKF